MNSQIHVVGNLAVAADEERRFTVIDGSASHGLIAAARTQLFAPAVYPKSEFRFGRAEGEKLALGLIATIVVACVFGIMFFGSAPTASKFEALLDAPIVLIEVSAGDTLWQIAEDHPIDGFSTSETVEAIRLVNDLESGLIAPGMELSLPVSQS